MQLREFGDLMPRWPTRRKEIHLRPTTTPSLRRSTSPTLDLMEKTTCNYMKFHKDSQLVGSLSLCRFGSAESEGLRPHLPILAPRPSYFSFLNWILVIQ